MLSTEAGGEGINLQFCSLMVNYDIPWNPNRLEQRMGRTHRYGQQKDVHIYNLVAVDTREGEVLYRLLEKLKEVRQALGVTGSLMSSAKSSKSGLSKTLSSTRLPIGEA